MQTSFRQRKVPVGAHRERGCRHVGPLIPVEVAQAQAQVSGVEAVERDVVPLELEKVDQHFAELLKRSDFEIEQDKQTLYHAINQVARDELSERNAS